MRIHRLSLPARRRAAAALCLAVLFSGCVRKAGPGPGTTEPPAPGPPSASGGESSQAREPAVPEPAAPEPASSAPAETVRPDIPAHIPLSPFGWEECRAVAAVAAGENFFLVPLEPLADDDRFAIEKYDTSGRLARRAALPELGRVLRMERAGDRLLVLGEEAVLELDHDLGLLRSVPVPQAVRLCAAPGAVEYDVAQDLSLFLYHERGGVVTETGWAPNGRPAGSTLIDTATGESRFLDRGDTVTRILPGGGLLMAGTRGSLLAGADGSGARPTGVGMGASPQIDGRWCVLTNAPVYSGDRAEAQNGVYDLESERFRAIPEEAWSVPEGTAGPRAAVGGGRLYSLTKRDTLACTVLATGEQILTEAALTGGEPPRSLLAATPLGAVLYEAQGALYLRAANAATLAGPAGERPAGASEPDLPLTMAAGTAALSNGKPVELALELTDGYYWDKDAPGYVPGGGVYEQNYTGTYHLVVKSGGEVLWDRAIALEDGAEMNFSGPFSLVTGDYNADGNPDFTLGQWGGSNGNRYQIFTVKPTGRVEPLDGGDFQARAFAFSIPLELRTPTSFEAVFYSPGVGDVTTVYTWNEEDEAFYKSAPEGREADAAANP